MDDPSLRCIESIGQIDRQGRATRQTRLRAIWRDFPKLGRSVGAARMCAMLGDVLKRGDAATAGSLYRVRAILESLRLAIGETLDAEKLAELGRAFVTHLGRSRGDDR